MLRVKKILGDKKAWESFHKGAHPVSFCAQVDMSLPQHFKLLESEKRYYDKFMDGITKCLSNWKKIGSNQFCCDLDTVQSECSIVPLLEREPQRSFDSVKQKQWDTIVKDIERYIPELTMLDNDNTLSREPLETFQIEFVQPSTVKDED